MGGPKRSFAVETGRFVFLQTATRGAEVGRFASTLPLASSPLECNDGKIGENGEMGRAFEPDFSIDLHGFHPDAAMERLRREVESGARRGKTLEVIHGCGRGVLRERVRAWAERSPMVRKIWPGEDCFLPGGGKRDRGLYHRIQGGLSDGYERQGF